MTTGVSNLMLESPLTKLANSRHKGIRILQSQTWHYGAPKMIVIIAGNLPASTDTWVVYEGALLDSNTVINGRGALVSSAAGLAEVDIDARDRMSPKD